MTENVWTLSPETDNVPCDVEGDPVARALCQRPELRALSPHDLAEELVIPAHEAQIGILRLASRASGLRVVLRGVSFDEAISAGGRAMGRHKIAYAREAGAFEQVGAGGPSPWMPLLLFSLAMGGIFAGLIVLEKFVRDLPTDEER